MVYIRWTPEANNLANLLIQRERVDPIRLADRASTPLIHHGPDHMAFTHSKLAAWFTKWLQAVSTVYPAILPTDTLDRYSWHSWRVTLSTLLAAARVPRATIMRMLRWASESSLNVYCRPTADDHSRNLTAAMSVSDHNATSTVWRHKDYCAHLARQLSCALRISDSASSAVADSAPIVDDTCFYDAWDKATGLIIT